jgi:hypothetical protein
MPTCHESVVVIAEGVSEYVYVRDSPAAPAPTPDAHAHRFTMVAGETLSGHRAVVSENGLAVYAEPLETNYFKSIGLTLGAAIEGSIVTVQAMGLITEPSWNWDTGAAIWLSQNGVLTQSVPTTGLQWRLGTAVSATTILWAPEGRPISI